MEKINTENYVLFDIEYPTTAGRYSVLNTDGKVIEAVYRKKKQQFITPSGLRINVVSWKKKPV